MIFEGGNSVVSPKATLGRNVRIGDRSVIYDNVVLEDGVTIANDCVIGEPQSRYYEDGSYENPKTTIGADSLIRSHAIVYSGVTLGSGFSCGHRVTIREGVKAGKECRVGTMTDIQNDVVLADYVWLHSGVFLAARTVLNQHVMIYPHAIIMDDPMPPSMQLSPVRVQEYSQIGAGARLLAGVNVGSNSLVGAGAVVTRDVEEFSCAVGNPAKRIKDVREMKMPDGTPAYPWPNRFDRGMPWEGVGYDSWMKSQTR